ncbi:phenylacetate--CoA ligase family protein [Haloferax sp. KTX1]|uniref:phenylacetate--CoA ligase family protein n=1 Tax=Haloferax sp. KTX1 TaxID=2600597 RepID=UPI0011DDEAC8|nr:AMP-binding protein [Haloferax sp. KTX1]
MTDTGSEAVYAEIELRDWDEVRTLQEERLLDQVEYLATESEYYREQFDEWGIDPDDVQSMDDFADIPFTVKEDERRNQVDPSIDQPLGPHQAADRAELARVMSSSGTTGEPTFFGLTSDDYDAWIEMAARSVYAAGARPDDVFLHAIGRTMVPGGLPYVEALQEIGATVVPAGDGSTERILKTADKLNVDGLFSTASHFQYLIERAPEVTDRTVGELPVTKLIGGGEPGIANPDVRSQLHEAYDADRVSEVMGIGDIAAALSGECTVENGMHFVGQEYVYLELIDVETGEPIDLEPGAEGEVVYTPLGREATPLLRFRSGDYARIIDMGCECGRTSPRFQIIGRADDMLIYKAQNIYPAGIREVVGEIEGASPKMKVVLPHEGKVQFDEPIPIEVARSPDTERPEDELVDDIATSVREQLNVRVDPTVLPSEEIELSEYKTDLVRVADD